MIGDEFRNEVGKRLRAIHEDIQTAQPHDAEYLQDCLARLAQELIIVASLVGVPPYDTSVKETDNKDVIE